LTDKAIKAPQLICYADAAYMNHADSKSHTGYLLKIDDSDGAPFHAVSSKQKGITLSSCQAEVESLLELTKEIIFWRELLQEIGLGSDEPTIIREDNMAAITLSKAFSGNTKRVKHFLLRINFIQEAVKEELIMIEYCPTEEMIADGLTKHMGSTGPYLFSKLLGANTDVKYSAKSYSLKLRAKNTIT